jgi:hypothetical protein
MVAVFVVGGAGAGRRVAREAGGVAPLSLPPISPPKVQQYFERRNQI